VIRLLIASTPSHLPRLFGVAHHFANAALGAESYLGVRHRNARISARANRPVRHGRIETHAHDLLTHC
jgi:hypothetical protein